MWRLLLHSISLRVGWCQPGENMPDTMSATGTPSIADDADDVKNGYSEVALGFDNEHKILPWFENMVSDELSDAGCRPGCFTTTHPIDRISVCCSDSHHLVGSALRTHWEFWLLRALSIRAALDNLSPC